MTVERFAPDVTFTDRSGLRRYYTPPGWMYILALALNGVQWAIREADSDAFRATIREWFRQQRIRDLEATIAHYEREIDRCRELLGGLE